MSGYIAVATLGVAFLVLMLCLFQLLWLKRLSREGVEPAVRQELRQSRDEAGNQARLLREEVANQQSTTSSVLVSAVTALSDGQHLRLADLSDATRLAGAETRSAIVELVEKTNSGLGGIRNATESGLDIVRTTLAQRLAAADEAQERRSQGVTDGLSSLTESNRSALEAQREALRLQLNQMQVSNEARWEQFKGTLEEKLRLGLEDQRRHLREVIDGLKGMEVGNQREQEKSRGTLDQKFLQIQESIEKRLEAMRLTVDEKLRLGLDDQRKHLDGVMAALGTLEKGSKEEQAKSRETLDQKFQLIQSSNESKLEAVRTTVDEKLRLGLEDQRKLLEGVIAALATLEKGNQAEQEKSREMLDQKFQQIQASNEKKLEEMRITVDEKLHKTLEDRLGASFKQVSDRLEAVHKGLGEMQGLASGVGDLKRVLTNVKDRGTWGEFQLAAILEQLLAPDQYAQNVAPKSNGERVEFAIRLPGQGQDVERPVWLPIDSKFPKEDYERLVEASQNADAVGVDAAKRGLLAALLKSAKEIQSKYISPPETTDFAIMFLPTEGLYAEALRQPGFSDELQRSYRVLIAGPTTLSAILTSLRVGFQTLAIEKRAHEIWDVLRAVKTEFGKFGDVLEKVKKQLATATNSLDQTATRSRAMERKLRSVESLPSGEALELLGLPAIGSAEPGSRTADIEDPLEFAEGSQMAPVEDVELVGRSEPVVAELTVDDELL